jgi:hypothetical protein
MYIPLEMLKLLVYEWHVKFSVLSVSVRHPYRSNGPCSILVQVECGKLQLETAAARSERDHCIPWAALYFSALEL